LNIFFKSGFLSLSGLKNQKSQHLWFLQYFLSQYLLCDFSHLVNTVGVVDGGMAVVETAVVNAHAVEFDFSGSGVRNGIVLVSYGGSGVVNLCGQTSKSP